MLALALSVPDRGGLFETNRVERLGDRIASALESRNLASVDTARLRPTDSELARPGTKLLLTLADPKGHEYVLKIAEPALVAAEVCAYELRQLGRRPVVPVRAVTVEVPSGGIVGGALKPFIEVDPEARLSNDTRTWSELQRSVMLREHAWEYLLDNLDTNAGQYALLGAESYPIDMDWDRAFASDGTSRLSRFAKYRSTLPNARTFLYVDYVEARISLNFGFLRAEARHIRRLPESRVREILERYAAVRFGTDAAAAREFVSRVLDRKRTIERDVQRFIGELRAERRELSVGKPRGLAVRTRALGRRFWNTWQKALDAVGRGSVGTAARHVLKVVRSRAALAGKHGGRMSSERRRPTHAGLHLLERK